jgi:hypothetical protein
MFPTVVVSKPMHRMLIIAPLFFTFQASCLEKTVLLLGFRGIGLETDKSGVAFQSSSGASVFEHRHQRANCL